MDFKELLKQAHNVDLPIRGGMGNSIEEAVILEATSPINDYVLLEYQIMDLISIGSDLSWGYKNQKLLVKEGRRYNKLIVAVRDINGSPMPLLMENHYFDITECANILPHDIQYAFEDINKIKMFLKSILCENNLQKCCSY